MGAAKKIWNEMEVAAEARENGSTEFLSSPLIVDTSLSLPLMAPRVMSVPSLRSVFCFKLKLFDLTLFFFLKLLSAELEFNATFFFHLYILFLLWFKIPGSALCKDLFKQWSKLDDSRFSVDTVSGGITNLREYIFANGSI